MKRLSSGPPFPDILVNFSDWARLSKTLTMSVLNYGGFTLSLIPKFRHRPRGGEAQAHVPPPKGDSSHRNQICTAIHIVSGIFCCRLDSRTHKPYFFWVTQASAQLTPIIKLERYALTKYEARGILFNRIFTEDSVYLASQPFSYIVVSHWGQLEAYLCLTYTSHYVSDVLHFLPTSRSAIANHGNARWWWRNSDGHVHWHAWLHRCRLLALILASANASCMSLK